MELLKYPFSILDPDFYYFTLKTFLMMVSLISLSTQMKLLSTLSVIWHVICGSN